MTIIVDDVSFGMTTSPDDLLLCAIEQIKKPSLSRKKLFILVTCDSHYSFRPDDLLKRKGKTLLPSKIFVLLNNPGQHIDNSVKILSHLYHRCTVILPYQKEWTLYAGTQ